MKTYSETGGHKGDTVKVRGTKLTGVVEFFESGLCGTYTFVKHANGERVKHRTVDLVLIAKGPGWVTSSAGDRFQNRP